MKLTLALLKPGFILSSCVFFFACSALVVPNKKTEFYELRAGDYALDPEHAFLVFRINHLGLSSYIGQFDEINASLVYDQENVANTQLEAIIELSSLDINNEELEDTLLGDSDWFNIEDFPQARFLSSTVTSVDDNTLQIKGELTLRGISQALTFEVNLIGAGSNLLTGAYTLGFNATAKFSRSDFGFSEYTGFIGDEIEMEINGEFQRQ